MQQKNKSANENYIHSLANIIKSHRRNIKKSMYLISAESSIGKTSWREIEQGMRKDINLSTFCKIAEGLEMQPYELLKELSDSLGKDFNFTDINI